MAFVGGQGKSGTTWVERLIDAHPHAACLGEGHFAEGLGRLLYRALDEYNQLLADNNRRFPELEDFPAFQAEDAGELVRAALLLQFAAIARRNPGATTVAVRTPSELNWLTELHRTFPQARFVHVLRDPARCRGLHVVARAPGAGPAGLAHGSPAGLAQALVPRWARHVARARARRKPAPACTKSATKTCSAARGERRRPVRVPGPGNDAATCGQCLEQASFSRLSGRRADRPMPVRTSARAPRGNGATACRRHRRRAGRSGPRDPGIAGLSGGLSVAATVLAGGVAHG